MLELIQELLLTHNCVVIPGFGALVANYQPSEIRLADNAIVPPNKSIAFNRLLQNNDGLLIHAFVRREGVAYKEADARVMDFSRECNQSLEQNKSLVLKDIGRFSVDATQKVLFQPYTNRNYLLDGYGLETLSLVPVERLKESEAELRENYQRVLHPEELRDPFMRVYRSALSYRIAAVIALIFLTLTLTLNIRQGTERCYSSLMPAFEKPAQSVPRTQVEAPAPAQPDSQQAVIAVQEPVNTPPAPLALQPAANGVALPSVMNQHAYIVVGAFFDEIHAGKVRAEAEAKGYTANISSDYNNAIYRVNIEVPSQELSVALEKIKADFNQRAWVYCTNCALN